MTSPACDVLVLGEINADLVVFGEINADLVVFGESPLPEFGQVERLVDSATLTIGSSSAITACALAALGLSVRLAGVVGDDALGRFMLDGLRERGVDISACVVERKLPTGVSIVLHDTAGDRERAILTAPGAIAALTAERLDTRSLASARHVHCGSYFLQTGIQEALPALFRQARGRGTTCSLDTNWDPAGVWGGGVHAAIDETDLLLPNEQELMRLAGTAETDAALHRFGSGPQVAVKLGSDGALLQAGGRRWRAAAAPVAAVDTTGAGDCFDAGAIYGLLAGLEPARQLALAVACGSLSTRGVGGTAAQPSYTEAADVARRIAVREL